MSLPSLESVLRCVRALPVYSIQVLVAVFVSDRHGCSIVKEAAILFSFYAITARPSAQLEAAVTYQI